MEKADFMEGQLHEIQSYLCHRDRLDPGVSEVAVAWHLDHSLKTINVICDSLVRSDPKKYKRSFSASRLFCFIFGYIPRGVAQSPKWVRPPESITLEALLEQLETAKRKLSSIGSLDRRAHIRHPYFKILNRRRSELFLQLHTEHHLKIVRDILGN